MKKALGSESAKVSLSHTHQERLQINLPKLLYGLNSGAGVILSREFFVVRDALQNIWLPWPLGTKYYSNLLQLL